jgi:hypothetical protein
MLGLALLWQGLQWYDAHLARISRGEPRAAVRVTRPVSPRPTPMPTPTAAEIGRLCAPDWTRRDFDVIANRSPTPALVAAVDACLVSPHGAGLEMQLICLKARLPGGDALAFAIAHLPPEGPDLVGEARDRCTCLVNALAQRASEDPPRVLEALLPHAFGPDYTRRQAALAGLSRTPVAELPPLVKVMTLSTSEHDRACAVRAAFALTAPHDLPEVAERALLDSSPSVREIARVRLESDRDTGTARIVAQLVAREPQDPRYLRFFEARRGTGAQDALVELALDESQPDRNRENALELLGTIGDAGLRDRIASLRETSSEVLRAYAVAAVAEQDRRSGRPVESAP